MTARGERGSKIRGTGDTMGRFVPSPFVRSAVHGDRTILLDLRRERYYSLDEVGTRVWALLGDGADVPAIVARLGEEYEEHQERLHADVGEVLRQLSQLKVIVPDGIQSNGGLPAAGRHRAVLPPRPGPLSMPSTMVCVLALVSATLALRVLGLRRTLALTQRLCQRPPKTDTPTPEFLNGVVRNVDTAAVFFPGRARCLEQSLALYLCLRRAGVSVAFRIGVQPYPFGAHAWVEHQNEPVGDQYDRLSRFVPFDDVEVI